MFSLIGCKKKNKPKTTHVKYVGVNSGQSSDQQQAGVLGPLCWLYWSVIGRRRKPFVCVCVVMACLAQVTTHVLNPRVPHYKSAGDAGTANQNARVRRSERA